MVTSVITSATVCEIIGTAASRERSRAMTGDLHRRAGLGEVLKVDELARKVRERLAEKIRPSEAPRPPEA
jgi:hypothetical protein